MANLEVLALDTTTPQIRAPGAGDGYSVPRDMTFSSGTTLSVPTVDATNVEVTNVKAKDGTAAIVISDTSGNVGIGGAAIAYSRVDVNGTLSSSGGFSIPYNQRGTIPSSTTTGYYGYYSVPTTEAASFTIGTLAHFYASQQAFGAGSAATNQYGFFAASTLIGATNNYGFYGNIATAANRWNCYMAGTAPNYFAGNVRIGTTSDIAPLTVLTSNATDDSTARVAVLGLSNTNMGQLEFRSGRDDSAFTNRYSSIQAWSNALASARDLILEPEGGNIGIGTASTGFNAAGLPLVVGSGSGNTGMTIFSGNASYGSIHFADAVTTGADSYRGYINYNHSTNSMQFATDAAERMRIDSSGNVGIGMTPSTDTLLEVYGSAAATCYKNVNTGTGSSDGFYVGCGKSSSTDAYVYNRESAPLIFGTANAERMRIDSEGRVGIGGATTASVKVHIQGALPTSGTNSFGIAQDVTFSNGATGSTQVFRSVASTAAAAFTVPNLVHYISVQATIGAGSSVTNQYGFFVDSGLTGATNNYGFYSDIASGANRWNFYANGTASNYFAGKTGIGTTTMGSAAGVLLTLSGSSASYTQFNVGTSGGGVVGSEGTGLLFYTYTGNLGSESYTERMRIDSSGNVGIGTASPTGRLNVSRADNAEGARIQNTLSTGLTSDIFQIAAFSHAAGTGFYFERFYSSGPTAQFAVRGDGTIYAQNTTVQSISDARVKENVRTATEGLAVIDALRPVRFDFKNGFGNNRKNQLGFVAQEVEAVFPDAVDVMGDKDENGDSYKSVGPAALIPVLVKAIQELSAKVAALEAK